MVSIRINLVEINKILERTEDIITDMSPFWDDAFDDVIVPKVKEVFETRGYGVWPPRKDNLPHPLLRKSERLFDSLTSRSHPDTKWEAYHDRFEFGTGVEYAPYHEHGTSRIPARPFLFFLCTFGFQQELADYADRWLQNRLDKLAA